jgi:hypothetical protein
MQPFLFLHAPTDVKYEQVYMDSCSVFANGLLAHANKPPPERAHH